jgi:tripeptidyl-peptidase-2
MSNRLVACCLSLFLPLGCAPATAAPPDGRFDNLLDTKRIGAAAFLRAHADWDGRGVVIAVLDTGVDVAAPGLQKTTDGKTKVIESRDFSGQGLLVLSAVETLVQDGVTYHKTDEATVRGLEKLPAPKDGVFQLGVLRESAFRSSSVTDLNGNGTTTDEFVVLTAETPTGVSAWVDVGGDLDVSDAIRVESYGKSQQTFSFPMRNPTGERPPMALSLYIADGGGTVEVCFDDGGHGTHVAGIAAGFGLMGRVGFDGIAPGAQILSLKIGDNTLAGGATTNDSMRRALAYAGEWSDKHATVVIANISYGIGSEREGASDMDVTVDELMAKHPRLVVSVAAGNEGPGLSTVGVPAGSRLATTTAALLTEGAAETLFGARIRGDHVFGFSSRGGEAAKPDLLAPGIATSSTPAWDGEDLKGGTSMAAPEVTGAYAVLASAAKARSLDVNSTMLKRALLASATPLPGFQLFDQGAGIPDIGRAFRLLEKLATHDEPKAVAGYRVTTSAPTTEVEVEGAYWRAGTYVPSADEGHAFVVEPVFFGEDKKRDDFHQIISLRSESPWIDLERRELRLRGRAPESIMVRYDADALVEPGVYSGRVVGTPDDGGGVPAFALWSTVVVPYTFGAAEGYALDREVTLGPADLARFPILVPAGASGLSVDVAPGDRGTIRLAVFDPSGRSVEVGSSLASARDGTAASFRIGEDALTPGTWELVLAAPQNERADCTATLSVRFRGLDFQPIRKLSLEPGATPTGRVKVTSRYDMRFQGTVTGSISGYRRERDLRSDGGNVSFSFQTNADIARVDLTLRLSRRDYARFTDVPITIFDEEGRAVEKDGFVSGVAHVGITPEPGSHTYRLEVSGSRANSDTEAEAWTLTVEERWQRHETIEVRAPDVTLWPGVPATIDFELDKAPPRTPDGYETLGAIRLTERRSSDVWAEIPIRVK